MSSLLISRSSLFTSHNSPELIDDVLNRKNKTHPLFRCYRAGQITGSLAVFAIVSEMLWATAAAVGVRSQARNTPFGERYGARGRACRKGNAAIHAAGTRALGKHGITNRQRRWSLLESNVTDFETIPKIQKMALKKLEDLFYNIFKLKLF